MGGGPCKLALLAVGLVGLSAYSPLGAVERQWLVRAADIIVVGRLRPIPSLPWADGWHMRGTVEVEEVLSGVGVPSKLSFRITRPFERGIGWWMPPRYPEFTLKRGIWFLRRVEVDVWESSLGFPDLGFRPVESRGEWIDAIRRYKHSAPSGGR